MQVCGKYFTLYDVDHETWANFATMHFVGNAAHWLQTYEVEHEVDNREELYVAIHAKFGKYKHHKHLEAPKHCKQSDIVENTITSLRALIKHTVLVYTKHCDEVFFCYNLCWRIEKRYFKSY